MTSLRRRMIGDMQVRNLSHNTQSAYVHQISRFARYCGNSPEALGPEDIRACQIYLVNEKKLAPTSIIIAVSAFSTKSPSTRRGSSQRPFFCPRSLRSCPSCSARKRSPASGLRARAH